MLKAGVVDQDVHRAIGGQRPVDECAAIGALAHVGFHERPAQPRGDVFARAGVDVGYHHLGAVGGEPFGNRQAEAAGGAGDDGDPVFEPGLGHGFQLSGSSTLFLNASRWERRLNQASTLGRDGRSRPSMPKQRQRMVPSGMSPMVSWLPAM